MDQQQQDAFSSDGQYEQGQAPQSLRAKPDGILEPAAEAGWFLERERLSRGLTLEDVAAATGIHPYHVEAIEYGDMTHMPPRLEALEMIAAYADYLGFDPEPLLQHYVSFLPSPQVAPRHHPANPAPMMSAKILPFGKFPKIPALDLRSIKLPPLPSLPGGRNGIVASVAAVFLLFSGTVWMFSGSSETPALELVAGETDPMPTATTSPDVADIKITDQAMTDEAAAEQLPVAGEGESDADQAALSTEPAAVDSTGESTGESTGDLGAFIAEQVGEDADPAPVAATSKPVELATNESHGGKVFGPEDTSVRVVLKALKPIWLLIEDGQGNRVATQMLNTGDMYRVPNREGLVAIAQDGGALVYMLDGEEKGVLGQPGSLLAAEPLDAKLLAKKNG